MKDAYNANRTRSSEVANQVLVSVTSVFFLIIFSKLTFNCRSPLQSLLQLLQFLFRFVSKEFYALLFFCDILIEKGIYPFLRVNP